MGCPSLGLPVELGRVSRQGGRPGLQRAAGTTAQRASSGSLGLLPRGLLAQALARGVPGGVWSWHLRETMWLEVLIQATALVGHLLVSLCSWARPLSGASRRLVVPPLAGASSS